MKILFMVLLFLTAVFLILIVLVQRGKGGGLAGAFGGMGGQSAFGTKAGDTFTKITMIVAALWIVLCVVSVRMLAGTEDRMQLGGPDSGLMPATTGQSATPDKPASGTESKEAAPAPESSSSPENSSPPAEKPAE